MRAAAKSVISSGFLGLGIAHLLDYCHASPDEKREVHECMADERQCVYCGIALHPYPCNGCGKFMTTREMHENVSRCDECM